MKYPKNLYNSCSNLLPIQIYIGFRLRKHYQLTPHLHCQLRRLCQPQQFHCFSLLQRRLRPLRMSRHLINDQYSRYVSLVVTQLNNLCFTSCCDALQLDNCFIKYDNATFIGVENMMAMSLYPYFFLLFLIIFDSVSGLEDHNVMDSKKNKRVLYMIKKE